MDAEQSGPPGAAPRSILLHVVSPSAEAQKLTFPDTPVNTTVGELKQMIQSAVASRPVPDRQRLIYQGRPLLRAETTLDAILSKDAIETSESFTFHVVLPPSPHSAPSNASDDQRHSSARVSEHTTPQAGVGNSTAQAGPGRLPFSYPQPTPPLPPHRLPPARLQQPTTNYNPFAGQHEDPSQTGMPPLRSTMPHLHHAHHHHHPQTGMQGYPLNTGLPQNAQQALLQAQAQAQQQQFRAHARFQGQAQQQGNNDATQEQNGLGTNRSHNHTPSNRTIIREGQIPGGHFRVIMNQTTIPLNRAALHTGDQQNPGSRSASPHPFAAAAFPPPAQPGLHTTPAMDSWRLPSATTFTPGPSSSGPPNQSFPPTVYLLSSPDGFQGLLLGPNGTHVSSGMLNTGRPEARYFPGRTPSFTGSSHRVPHSANPFSQPDTGPSSPAVPNMPNPPATPPVDQPAQDQPDPANPQAAQQNPNDEAANLLRIIVPIGGHLWVALRLLGVMWLLTNGFSWTRIVLTGIVVIFFLLAQAGALTGPADAIATPIRRHLENLLRDDPDAARERARREIELRDGVPPPVDGRGDIRTDVRTDRERRGQEGHGNGEDGAGRTGQRQNRRIGSINTPEPSPQQVAQRLLQERRQQDLGWARAQLRRAERALFLFMASLVPGVGELHVQAREAADRRAREEAEQEVRRSREEREAREVDGSEQVHDQHRTSTEVRATDSSHEDDTRTRPVEESSATVPEGRTNQEGGLRNRQGHTVQADVD